MYVASLLTCLFVFAPPAEGGSDQPGPIQLDPPTADEASDDAPAEAARREGSSPSPVMELSGRGPEGPAPAPAESEVTPAATPQATDPESAPTKAAPAPAEKAEPAPTVARRQRPQREYPDIPIRWRLEAMASGAQNVLFHPSYMGYSYDRKLGGFDGGIRLDYRAGDGRVFLGGGLTYRYFSSARDIYSVAAFTDLTVHEPALALRLAIQAIEAIDVYAELSGGPSIIDTGIEYDAGDAADRKVTGTGTGLGGVMLYLPKKWLPRKGSSHVTVGIDFGLGYAFRGGIAVEPKPEVSEDDELIEPSAAPLGTLQTRGMTWRLGLFLRFM